MIKQDWINKVKTNANILRDFISRYHPINLRSHRDGETMDNITAPDAERACEIVREQIRRESFECPDIQFNIALLKEDSNTIS